LKVTNESIGSFTIEFESDEELRDEFEATLSAGDCSLFMHFSGFAWLSS
jgi:hypothetical protein